MLGKLRHHWPRVRHQLGGRLPLGGRSARVRGYVPNHLATDTRHEPHLLAPLRRAMAATSGPVIDVGVNTGQTLMKVLTIDPARAYTGFEPQAGCCFFVDQFLRDNGFANAGVVCLALSDEDRLLPFYSSGDFDEMATLPGGEAGAGIARASVRYVPARVGDAVLAEMGITAPGIVKVDVEGAEISVFRGLAGTIRRARPVCLFEVLPNFEGHERRPVARPQADVRREGARELFAFFAGAGYEIRQVLDDGGERAISGFELDDPAAYVGNDYVAWPKERGSG